MKWNLSLSGDHAACREQLNKAVHALTVHSDENAAKRAVAHHVAVDILDPAQREHEAAVAVSGPQTPGRSLSIVIDVSVSAN